MGSRRALLASQSPQQEQPGPVLPGNMEVDESLDEDADSLDTLEEAFWAGGEGSGVETTPQTEDEQEAANGAASPLRGDGLNILQALCKAFEIETGAPFLEVFILRVLDVAPNNAAAIKIVADEVTVTCFSFPCPSVLADIRALLGYS